MILLLSHPSFLLIIILITIKAHIILLHNHQSQIRLLNLQRKKHKIQNWGLIGREVSLLKLQTIDFHKIMTQENQIILQIQLLSLLMVEHYIQLLMKKTKMVIQNNKIKYLMMPSREICILQNKKWNLYSLIIRRPSQLKKADFI